jgi:hypothetical protein
LRKLALVVPLVALLMTTVAHAADSPDDVIGAIGLPSVKDKRWVRFNTGQHWKDQEERDRFACQTGWLLEERPNEVVLLTRGLVTVTLARKRELPEGFDPKNLPEGVPLPGELLDLDFDKLTADFLGGGVQRYYGFEAMDHAREGGLDHPAEAALLAHWQRERGKEDPA